MHTTSGSALRGLAYALLSGVARSQTGYTIWTSGQCATPIQSLAGCSQAAIALGLSDTTASGDGQNGATRDPPYCYWENNQLKFNSGSNTGGCSNRDRCICAGVGPPLPPPPPVPAPPPLPHPPGAAPPPASYFIQTTGSCADPVTTIAECAVAAQAVYPRDTTPTDDNQGAGHPNQAFDPPYCCTRDGRKRPTSPDGCLACLACC